jgi:hypothetical protein
MNIIPHVLSVIQQLLDDAQYVRDDVPHVFFVVPWLLDDFPHVLDGA